MIPRFPLQREQRMAKLIKATALTKATIPRIMTGKGGSELVIAIDTINNIQAPTATPIAHARRRLMCCRIVTLFTNLNNNRNEFTALSDLLIGLYLRYV